MILGVVVIVVGAIALASTSDSGTTPHHLDQGVLLQGDRTDFFLGSDTATVSVSDTSNRHHEHKQPLHPVDVLSPEFKHLLSNRVVPEKDECSAHKVEKDCIVDVSCGWCSIPGGGSCVEGSYAGPSDVNRPCPMYTTYQTPILEDIAEEDVSHLWEPNTNSTNTNSTDLLSSPDTDTDTDEKQIIYPIQDFDPRENSDRDTSNLAPVPVPEPAVRNPWVVAKKEHPLAPPRAVEPVRNRNPVPIVTNPDAKSGFDASVSPCGLPGVPDFICKSWLKMHCGPDQLNEDVLKNPSAANNGYDWCATLFENNPEIFLPPPAPLAPWYINGQLVH
jgi:hypothetical protein